MFATSDGILDNGDARNGERVDAEIIELPLRGQRRIVRRRGSPSAEVIELQPHLRERERQLRVIRRARQIRAILADADCLTGADSDEAVW
jgi:hypothetical protein